jgi:hypothetical protein
MRNKILMIVSLLAVVLVMNSCLKDNVGMDWTSSLKGKMYAEVWQGGKATIALQPVPDAVTFKFLVNIASDQPPTEDITVTLAVNDSARTRYNRLNGTAFKLYPYIQILTPNVVITKGTRNAYAYVKVWNAHLLNACDNFMAPISIMSATGGVIPADPVNMGSRLMTLPIANPFAGDYDVIGYRIHPAPAIYTVSTVETLSTVDCKTVIKHLMGDYPYDVTIEVTTNTMTVLGTTCYKVITHVFDPATGAIVSSGDGMATSLTVNLAYPPAPPSNDINYYNPVTKKFVLNYFYNTAAPRMTYEHLTRK